eukprot:15449715-Alexandrium_andersonii.AAC.1
MDVRKRASAELLRGLFRTVAPLRVDVQVITTVVEGSSTTLTLTVPCGTNSGSGLQHYSAGMLYQA